MWSHIFLFGILLPLSFPMHAEKPSQKKNFRAQISSTENVLIRDAILAPVAKQWIAKDIRVTGANQNAQKLLFTNLLNANVSCTNADSLCYKLHQRCR